MISFVRRLFFQLSGPHREQQHFSSRISASDNYVIIPVGPAEFSITVDPTFNLHGLISTLFINVVADVLCGVGLILVSLVGTDAIPDPRRGWPRAMVQPDHHQHRGRLGVGLHVRGRQRRRRHGREHLAHFRRAKAGKVEHQYVG